MRERRVAEAELAYRKAESLMREIRQERQAEECCFRRASAAAWLK